MSSLSRTKRDSAYNKFTYEEVAEFVKNESTSLLLSKEYVKADAKMLFLCECGKTFETTFSCFKYKNKRRCDECSGICTYTTNEVWDIYRGKGLEPLVDEYKSSHAKVKCKTKEGYLVEVSLDRLRKNKKINIYHVSNPYSIDNVHRFIEINNISAKCISHKYMGSNIEKMEFICECGNHFKMAWCDFRSRNQCCPECGVKRRSGEKHYGYNKNLTEVERIERRAISSTENMRKFRQGVFERDDYTCAICGAKSTIINAHHLNGYHWFKEGRYDINNGVTLCEKCHKKFHEIYGRTNNTEKQYREFCLLGVCV